MTDETIIDPGATVIETEAAIASERPRRVGRPRGAAARAADPVRLEGQTTKSYALGDGAQRTIRYLRRIVNQRQIPDEAAVAIEGGRITIEWSE